MKWSHENQLQTYDLTNQSIFRGRNVTSVTYSQKLEGGLAFMVLDSTTVIAYLSLSRELIFKLKVNKDSVILEVMVLEDAA